MNNLIVFIVTIYNILSGFLNIKTDFKNIAPTFFEETNVIYSSKMFDKIEINKGKNDNVEEGDILFSKGFLVGIITEVKENTSTAQLIYNSQRKLSVKVDNKYGVISKYENNYLILENIKGKVRVGDKVFTTGIGYIYPENLYVGSVEVILNDKILVKTEADFGNFNDLEIVKR